MSANEPDQLIADFKQRVDRIGISLTAVQMAALEHFCQLIAIYAEHTNIVGNADLAVLLGDHVLDSLTLVPIICEYEADHGSLRLVDLGSGAGFPAIVLALVNPQAQVTMIEAVGKKCKFLEHATNILGLSSRSLILNGRAETLAHEQKLRSTYDFGFARAVGSFDLTAELVLPFLKRGGLFVSQKSAAQRPAEEERARLCLPQLGGCLQSVIALDAEALGKEKVLLVGRKTKDTLAIYPRSWSQIKARPLGAPR
jgi:16S rRNA (guanine527-N7)-methyltransferase